MKKIFLAIGILFLCCVSGSATLLFLSEISKYYLAVEDRSFSDAISSTESPSDVKPSDEALEAIEYCDKIKNQLNFVSVSFTYLETVPNNYHTWTKDPNGPEKEIAYYQALCSLSLQIGRPLTDSEAQRLAYRYIVPELELKYNLLNLWWLWAVGIFCLYLLIAYFFPRRKVKTEKVAE